VPAKQQDNRRKGSFPAQELDEPELESEMEPRPDYGLESYRGCGRLTDRAAVVTGGDSGIGRAVALAFAREGADVAISYLEADEDAYETAGIVENEGRRCVAVRGDIGSESHCKSLIEQVLSELGRLDILVNNAAYQMERDSIEDIPTEEFDRIFRTNVYSMFFLCRAALPRMSEGGAIINTASIQAYEPSPTLLPYAATKGAIVTFSKALAKEAIRKGVRVNVIAPGPVWTPLIPMSFSGEHVAKFGKNTPIGRAAQPAELAPAYVFLASPESGYIVGEVIGVTGGRLLP
jgi:NAD(P)-dependent dehydrogenase (short-subunit alcohol dehydrogenase family)